MEMTRDQLEFAISQYLDGTLMPAEKAALEERLARDAEARALLEEYRKLDAVMKAPAAELAGVKWDVLAQHISNTVAKEEIPATSYVMRRIIRYGSIAIAACVLITTGIWILRPIPMPNVKPNEQIVINQPVIVVEGPKIETASASPVIQITIGPPPTVADAGTRTWHYADGVVARSTHVLIASGLDSGQDSGGQLPF